MKLELNIAVNVIKKRILAYLSATLPVEFPSKCDFVFQLTLFIRIQSYVCVRVTWGLVVLFNYVYTCLISNNVSLGS
jgi:hypothetical protein